MSCNSAISIRSTNIRSCTRIDTFSWLTCSVVWAIIVSQAPTYNGRKCDRFYNNEICRWIMLSLHKKEITYLCYMQWLDYQNTLGCIHRYLCDFLVNKMHWLHRKQVSMQEHSYPVNTSGQIGNQSLIHIEVWQSLKETNNIQHASCAQENNRFDYHFHKYRHCQLKFPQDKYMQHF